ESDENLLYPQFDQPLETPVAGLGLAEAGIGRNDEGLLTVHRRAVTAGEGKLSRKAQVAQIVEAGQVLWGVKRLDVDFAVGAKLLAFTRLGDLASVDIVH